jgi:uncharacterized protein Yka (UPF0111/DUF47 family)
MAQSSIPPEITLEFIGEQLARLQQTVRDEFAKVRDEFAALREDVRIIRHRITRIEDRFDSIDETLLRVLQDNRDFSKRLARLEDKESQ